MQTRIDLNADGVTRFTEALHVANENHAPELLFICCH